jgi:hypothetical protein
MTRNEKITLIKGSWLINDMWNKDEIARVDELECSELDEIVQEIQDSYTDEDIDS